MRKKSDEKVIETQKVKLFTPTQAIDELMREEEQTGKKRENNKKETGSRPPSQLSGPFCRLLRPDGSIW